MKTEDGGSWKVILRCTREEAEAVASDLEPFAEWAEPPVLMAREPDSATPEQWLIEAYFESPPGRAAIAAVRALAPSAKAAPEVEHVPPADWVSLSQAGIEPVEAGRFFVSTPEHRHRISPGSVPFVIEAGLAFGTGQHETTSGCLEQLDRMRRMGERFDNVLDVGTGTGLLAFASQRLWPRARVIASDIDPIAVEVAGENAAVNGFATGPHRGAIELVVADGLSHPRLRRRAPYDLLIANILAGPLIEMAPALASAIVPGGSLLLAGLLDHQADALVATYRREGMRLRHRRDRNGWPSLLLVKRRG